MKKFTTLASSWLLTCLSLSAAYITPEQALQRLDSNLPTRSASPGDLKFAHTVALPDGEPGLYVFKTNQGKGYAILSADDVAAPLLGYSEHGVFDSNSMSPEMKWWLQEYTRQIEYARMNGAAAFEYSATRSERTPITPLLPTKWDQNSPYNLQTPEINGRHCVTGCVATAMAQVMKYWNYPEIGKGIVECTVMRNDGTTGTDLMDLSEQNFDWSNMLDSYDGASTEEQQSAVAYLMKACGYATNMNYGLKDSGTAVFYVATSLVNNFEYNKNIQYCQRQYYIASDWSDLLYGELEAGRPIVYGGQSTEAGHCFVCDGYSSDGYFHFNWGWGGMSDGYFLLDALNPESLGIGANGGGYNFGQTIVVGIQPTEGKEYMPNFVQVGNMQATVSNNTFTLDAGNDGGWYNYDTKSIIIDVAAKIEPLAPTTGETTYTELIHNADLNASYGWRNLILDIPNSVKDGDYRLTVCYRVAGTEEWTPVLCQWDCYNYVDFTKKESKYTIIENKKALPEIVDATILTPLYFGEALKMSVTVKNPSSKEITSYCYPALYSGDLPKMTAQGVTVTLAPGETVTKEFICVFELLRGKAKPTEETVYQLCFYDPSSQENTDNHLDYYPGFSKDVDMKIDQFELDLTVEDFVIKDYDTSIQHGRYFYNVTDPASIPFSMTITNNAEYFGKSIDIVVFPYPGGTSLAIEPFTPFALLNQGESAQLSVNVNLVSGVIGESYFAMPYIGTNPLGDYRLYFTLTDYDAVEGIEGESFAIAYDKATSSLKVADGVASLAISAMDGTVYDMSAEAASGSVDLSAIPAGVYVVNATGLDGTVKTIKIMK